MGHGLSMGVGCECQVKHREEGAVSGKDGWGSWQFNNYLVDLYRIVFF